jgi:hypothetical protein
VVLIVLGFYLRDYRSIAAIVVPYITVNIYNYSGLVVTVTNNLISLILSRVGHRDLGICFSDNLSL